MGQKGKKQDGRASDLTFSWMLTTLGTEWQQWQELAAEWMKSQNIGVSGKRNALSRFFESYITEYATYAIDNIDLFFKGYKGHVCSSEELEKVVRITINSPFNISKSVNYSCDFIDFVIEKVFSEEDDNGNLVPLVQTRSVKLKYKVMLRKPFANLCLTAIFRTYAKYSVRCPKKSNSLSLSKTSRMAKPCCLPITTAISNTGHGRSSKQGKVVKVGVAIGLKSNLS